MKKVTFEEMLESMSARLHLIETERSQNGCSESRAIAIKHAGKTVSSNSLPYTKEPRVCLPISLTEPENISAGLSTSSSWFSNYNPIGREINLLRLCGLFHQLTADLDWNDSALRAQFYFGLSYESRMPWSTSILLPLFPWQSKAIKVDNRLYERRLERTEDFQHFLEPTPRRPPPPSPMVVPPPRSNDMDIDFARRGPLTSEERQQRMSRGLCLRLATGDGAHDMMVRFEKVVLAPRGETGSITQMPPTTPLHPHSSAISTLSNISNPIHCQPLDSCLHISSLSSLNKLLLPGTLRIGPSTHVDTFFVDCGADDLFVDSKLAADLHIPLVKLSTPIQLRLADGDSSSVISHRTLNPISGDCSLASILSLDSIQEGVYPFVEASPLSESGVPADILSQFESVFSKDLAETLPPHRDFDCSIELIPGSVPAYGKIYHLTREEDTVMQEWIKDNLRQGFIRSSSSPHGAPCFFVKQKDKLRLCMDYRGLNKIPLKTETLFL
ncbi:hypothetical protein BASA83_009170 [Batrachochytrium salamandrivorans]|nr:hypothetical protein BASA83_009170 [Batrachochytrium salamandrivorans]